MRKSFLILVGVMISTSGQAQSVDVDLQEEITRESGQVEQVKESQVAPSNQRIVILNQQPVNQKVEQQSAYSSNVQVQPTTQVEASPLTESRAAQMRRVRENAELETEQKIVEKLEKSRLEDERRRADLLFGNRLDQTAQQETLVQPEPVVQAVPQTIVVTQEDDKESMKSDILSEVRNELIAEKVVEAQKKNKSKTYFSGMIGLTEYTDAVNVESNYATGFSIGYYDDGLILEGGFTYSNHYILNGYWYSSRAIYNELDQYNFTVAAKYAFLPETIRPYIGGIAGYTYREYTEKNAYADYWYNNVSKTAESGAFDFGVTAGIDIVFNDKFVLGAEYRYMMNLTYKTDSPFLNSPYRSPYGSPLEEFDYSTFAIVGKILY